VGSGERLMECSGLLAPALAEERQEKIAGAVGVVGSEGENAAIAGLCVGPAAFLHPGVGLPLQSGKAFWPYLAQQLGQSLARSLHISALQGNAHRALPIENFLVSPRLLRKVMFHFVGLHHKR